MELMAQHQADNLDGVGALHRKSASPWSLVSTTSLQIVRIEQRYTQHAM